MSYKSIVYRILIASPSDVSEEREVTSRIIQNWNDVNSHSKKIVLLPLRWETHSAPSFDVRPQEAINGQLVDDADLVIGLFWAKIGSETGVEVSGTIEEIKRAARNGKDVMIYFSKRRIDPTEIDLDQLRALNKFKKDVYKNALVENFSSIVDFRDKLFRQLEFKIRELRENDSDAKAGVDISFLDKKTGQAVDNRLKVSTELVYLDKVDRDGLFGDEKDVGMKRYYFDKELHAYIKKMNCLPVVLGVKNSGNIIHHDLHVDLQLEASVTDSIRIAVVGSPNQTSIQQHLESEDMKDEDEKEISALYTETLEKTGPRTMSIFTEQLTVLPSKVKCLKPLILLYPKKNVSIKFNAKILSNHLLSPISKVLIIDIETKRRKMGAEEIKSVFEKSTEYLGFS